MSQLLGHELNTKKAVKDFINQNGDFVAMELNLLEKNAKSDKVPEKFQNSIPEGAMYFEGIASNGELNRNGYIIREEAWTPAINGYMQNPVVLLQHNPEKPIGQTLHAEVNEKGLSVKGFVYPTEEIKNGLIKSLSTGHITKGVEFEHAKTKEVITEKAFHKLLEKAQSWSEWDEILKTWILAVNKLEWVEYSFVTIPSNRKSKITHKNALENYCEPMKNTLMKKFEEEGKTLEDAKKELSTNSVEEEEKATEEVKEEEVKEEETKEEVKTEETEEEVSEEVSEEKVDEEEKIEENKTEEEEAEEEKETEEEVEENEAVDLSKLSLEELQAELNKREEAEENSANEEEEEKEEEPETNSDSDEEVEDKSEEDTDVETPEKEGATPETSENEVEKAKEENSEENALKNLMVNGYSLNSIVEQFSAMLIEQNSKIKKLEGMVANLPNDKSAVLTSQFGDLIAANSTKTEKKSGGAMLELMKNAQKV